MRFSATTVVRLESSFHCYSLQDYVDKVRAFENEETNNGLLLCQGMAAENPAGQQAGL
jgi:hypothetical protein